MADLMEARSVADDLDSAAPLLSLRDVSFAYDREPVLDHVDLTVGAHDFLAIIGPNGGGKTTLLKIMFSQSSY